MDKIYYGAFLDYSERLKFFVNEITESLEVQPKLYEILPLSNDFNFGKPRLKDAVVAAMGRAIEIPIISAGW